jgi:hypothetical protein
MDYYSFDLRVSDWNPDAHTGTAEVLRCPAGECPVYPFQLDLDVERSSGRVHRTASAAVELGQRLSHAILSRDALTLWYESYQLARERERGLRLRLHLADWELARLPWELLYDDRRHEFIVFDPMVSLVRYIRLQSVLPRLRQSSLLCILVAVASPSDQLPLDWPREVEVLRQGLRELVEHQQAELVVLEHTTAESLHATLLDLAPHVVHFVGHAEYTPSEHRGAVLLEDEQGRGAPMDASEAARLLRRYRTNLVVLNACDTASGSWAGLAPALVRAEIPAVVAMQWPVEDAAAIRFSRAFYRALAMGSGIDECVSEGRIGASMGSRDPNDWAAPVLFLRSVSGQLWTSQVVGRQEAEMGARPEPVLRGGVCLQPGAEQPEDLYPFKTRGPLLYSRDDDLIVERREMERALRIARQPAVTQYVAILSTRQTGKTTLLFALMERLRELYFCVFVDLSVLRAHDAAACFRYVAFQMLNDLQTQYGGQVALEYDSQIESATDFERFLSELARSVPAPRILLLFDEVGGLNHDASDTFFNTWRAIFHNGRKPGCEDLSKYLCVFSGAVDLQQLTSGMNSPLNICEKLYLADLDQAAVAQIVGHFGRMGVETAPEVAEYVYQLTSGHPYLTMRLCALAAETHPNKITTESISAAVERLLADDDNLSHVIRQLEENPQARRRLKSILDGRHYHFMRSDPVLAALEMIGAIAGTQPCRVRNALYERALRAYFANSAAPAPLPSLSPKVGGSLLDSAAVYERLDLLRRGAQNAQGCFVPSGAWRTFAAALLALVPDLTLYAGQQEGLSNADVLVSVNEEAPDDAFWADFRPSVLVACRDLTLAQPEALLQELCDTAHQHQCRLVILVPSAPGSGGDLWEQLSGRRQNVMVALLDAVDMARIISERHDLDTLLRDKVLQTRLRRI